MEIREDEADRLAQMSDDEFAKAMAALPDPAEVPELTAEEGRARLPASGPLLRASVQTIANDTPQPWQASRGVRAVDPSVDGPRTSRLLWPVAAAAAVLFIVVERDALIALFRPVPKPDSPLVARARDARDAARQACNLDQWKTCADKLDEAAKLDPAGDASPEVRQLRERVREGLRPIAPSPDDPKKK
jgi:hypothetical protein